MYTSTSELSSACTLSVQSGASIWLELGPGFPTLTPRALWWGSAARCLYGQYYDRAIIISYYMGHVI